MTQRTEIRKMFGSFWNEAWKDEDFYNALVTSMEFLFSRLSGRADALPLFLSRLTVPTKEYKEADYVLASELVLTRKYVTLGSFQMDGGHTLDELADRPAIWAMPTPAEDISVITDSPVNPQLMWSKGSDFDIVDGELLLYADPFAVEFRQHMQQVDDENIRLVDLWLLDVTNDEGYLPNHYGRVVDMITPSDEYYKKILNAVYDLLQEGATRYRVAAFVGSIVDTDVCCSSGEVSAVWNEGGRTWVAVGDILHSCPGTGQAAVSLGDAVTEGSLLFNTFSITSGRDTVDPTDFPALILGPAFVDVPSGSGLAFANAELETTTYKFPIGGYAADVDYFWERAAANAAARGISLQDAIIGDQRRPWTVNPLEFMRSNFLSTSTMFVAADLSVVPDQEALKLLRYLDLVLPAGTTYFMNIFGEADEEDTPLCLDDELPGALANDGDEVDSIVLADYVIGREQLY